MTRVVIEDENTETKEAASENTIESASDKSAEEAKAKAPGEEGGEEDTAKENDAEKSDAPEKEEALSEEDEESPEDGEEPPEKEEAEGEKEEPAEEKKKGFKWKKDKKDKRDEKIEELTDRVKRQMAEFENFRKRTEKEKSSMYEMGARSVIEKILPVIDNFERGLDSVPEDEKDSPFTEGMRKIYKQLLTELEGLGVTPIECVGKEFDPNFHNAVMQVASDEYESGIVAQEMLKGYMYRDSVVRHSMVSVVE